MISFIKAAIAEIEHVVWPTQKETKKYFGIVTTMIISAAAVLFIYGSLVSAGMFAARNVFPHDIAPVSASGAQTEDVLQKIPKLKKPSTGSGAVKTVSGAAKVLESGATTAT